MPNPSCIVAQGSGLTLSIYLFIYICICHTHTGHTDRENTPDTGIHTRTTRPPNEHLPQTLTTLNGGATTVRATSHARVGGRAEVSIRGRVEV